MGTSIINNEYLIAPNKLKIKKGIETELGRNVSVFIEEAVVDTEQDINT